MNTPNNNKEANQTSTEDRTTQITDYLQAPRRKRKNFIILAMGKQVPKDLTRRIEGFIKSNYGQLATVHPESMADLRRLFGRNISLLIVNHDFVESETELMKAIKSLKEMRRNERIPVLFLTKHPNQLIAAYQKYLLIHQELDDYVTYDTATVQTVLSRVRDGVEVSQKRRTRRFATNHQVTFFHLNLNEQLKGRIIDVSFHGANLVSDSPCTFKEGEQMLISIPIHEVESIHEGEFLKVSARVRRVFIGGDHVGISFEHMNENQAEKMARFVVGIASINLRGQTARLKAAHEAEQKANL